MKKLVALFIIMIMIVNSLSIAYASTNLMDNQLAKLGFTDDVIKFLSEEEKSEIIDNQYKFIGGSNNNTLFVDEVKTYDNGNRIIKSYAIPLSESKSIKYNILEKTSFKNSKFKDSFLKEELKIAVEKNKIEPQIYYLSKSNEQIDKSLVSSNDAYEEDSIDYCILTTGVYAYDKSTSTKIIKRLGFNFQWEGKVAGDVPAWALKDLIAISHTGGNIGFANIEAKGGSYSYYQYDNSLKTLPISVTANIYGATGNFDMKMANKSYGSMYLDISNSKNAIPAGSYFTMFGQYGHVTLASGASVSVSQNGISFSPTIYSKVIKSTQVMYNNIFTY